jgi:N-acetyl-gamma-glutamyl-phosphate reductase
MTIRSLVLVGGRGFAGGELLRLLGGHTGIRLAAAVSRGQAGMPVQQTTPSWPDPETCFVAMEPADVGSIAADAWVLALPNGVAAPWVEAIRSSSPDAVMVDFSADYRFDNDWVYGLPERNRDAIRQAKQISNPGCYATGAQLAIEPLSPLLAAPPVVFGVSGYSGAGRTPSPRNNPDRLADNLIPYALSGHMHEREVSVHLGCEVCFHPHVAAFFRGISLTVSVQLKEPVETGYLVERYRSFYAGESGIRIQRDIPEIRDVAGTPGMNIGGFTIDPRDPCRVTLVAALDNLLKGAASQALQNLNLALGFDEWTGMSE